MQAKTFLVSRTDRAGDVILTLPVFRELRKNFPESRIIAHVRKYTAPLLSLCPEVDELIIDDDFAAGVFSGELKNAFVKSNITHAIMVHPSARSLIAVWRAGIPFRTGRASNLWQFLLNYRQRQKRSRNEKHEFCYNIDLLKVLINRPEYEPYRFSHDSLAKVKFDMAPEIEKILQKNPVIIHPGHGGSAFNISPEMYSEIADELIKLGKPVLISIGPGEDHIKQHFSPMIPEKLGFLENIPDLAKLAVYFSRCSAFVGGSTGPLHLAASIGLPCVAFFPPVKAMTPVRWGPVGCKSFILSPEAPPCAGKCDSCRLNGCMDTLSKSAAIELLLRET